VALPYGFGWGEPALGAAAPPGPPPPPPAEALAAGLPDDPGEPDGLVLAMPDGLVLARAEGLRPDVAVWLV
jgi:hypothetical protein